MKGWYDEHPDVGRMIETIVRVPFSNGSKIRAGARGTITSVEPAVRAWYLVAFPDGEHRSFSRDQFRFLSVLELLAQEAE